MLQKKLNALSRQCAILPFYRRKMCMNAFFNSQFSHCSLVWMSHSRSINTKINNLLPLQELLYRDKSVTIHLQFLATDMFKVANGMSPSFMRFLAQTTIFVQRISLLTRDYNHNFIIHRALQIFFWVGSTKNVRAKNMEFNSRFH